MPFPQMSNHGLVKLHFKAEGGQRDAQQIKEQACSHIHYDEEGGVEADALEGVCRVARGERVPANYVLLAYRVGEWSC